MLGYIMKSQFKTLQMKLTMKIQIGIIKQKEAHESKYILEKQNEALWFKTRHSKPNFRACHAYCIQRLHIKLDKFLFIDDLFCFS